MQRHYAHIEIVYVVGVASYCSFVANTSCLINRLFV